MVIRQYRESDRIDLIAIFKLHIPEYFDPKEEKDYSEYLNESPESYFTVENDGKIIGGFGCPVNRHDGTGQITWIFFRPELKGKSFGRKAVEYCLNVFKSSGIRRIVVTTSQKANKFFEKFDFELIRTEKDFWGKGLDLYYMEKNVEY